MRLPISRPARSGLVHTPQQGVPDTARRSLLRRGPRRAARAWAPVVLLRCDRVLGQFAICPKGTAVACTIDEPIAGFRGLKKR